MKALVIASNTPLLQTMLYKVLGFERDQVQVVDPKKPFRITEAPDVIIPCGQDALDKLNIEQPITAVAGKILDYQDVPVVPVFGSGYVEKNTHLMRRWAEDFNVAYQTMCGITALEKSNQLVVVTDGLQLMDLIDYIKRSGYVAFDFETTKLTDLKTHDPDFFVIMLALTFQQGSSYVIPLYHPDSPNSKEFIETCREQLQKEVFLNPDITKIGQNVKFDLHCLDWWGIPVVNGPIHDTMVMHHLLDEHTLHGLKKLVSEFQPRFSGYEDDKDPDWLGPIQPLMNYAGLDSDLTFRIYWQFTERLLDEDERLYVLFRNLIAPATPALFAMEQRGMLIDKEYLLSSIERVKEMIEEIDQEMREVPALKRYEAHRAENFMTEYVEDLERRLDKRIKMLEDRKAKKLETLKDRLERMKVKEFKTEKAAQNNEERCRDLEAEIQMLEEETPSDDTTKKWNRIIQGFDAGMDEFDEYLKEDQLYMNFASPAQMTELLFGPAGFKFKVPNDQYGRPLRDSAKGTLELLPDKTGFIDNLLALRQLKKILSTYLEGILARTDRHHRIHGTFNQHGTKTGRLSASDPNLQNIIKRTKYKKVEEAVAMVMKCFIPPKGDKITQADYSQAELRLIAFYADDKAMLGAYNSGEDIHALTAATTMGMSLEKFKELPDKDRKQYRYEAKSTNFGFVYGMSAEGFKEYARTSYGIEVSLKQAKERRAAFFKKYYAIPHYHQTYIAKAKKFGYVRTLFGRKVRLPDIYSNEAGKQSHAERNSVNSPIQGTAGEMMIFAIALLYRRAPGLQTANTVHDSLVYYGNQYSDIVKETMENLPMMEYFGKSVDTVGMVTDFEESESSWGELKEI